MFQGIRTAWTTFWLIAPSQWTARRGRSLLTALSIAIAVATLIGISLSSSAARRAYRDLARELEGTPALEVLPAAEDGAVADAVVERLRDDPRFIAVAPRIRRGTIVRFQGKRAKTYAAGVEFDVERELARWQLDRGRLPQSPPEEGEEREAVVHADLAKSLNADLDSEILIVVRGIVRLRVVGIFSTPPSVDPPGLILLPVLDAREIYRSEARVDEVRLYLTEDAPRDELQKKLQAELGGEVTVRKPLVRARIPDSILKSSELGLNFASATAALMAVFVCFNTFQMNVSERKRQFAILRVIGGSNEQVTGLVLAEAAVLGFIGTVLGLLAGWGMAFGLARAAANIMESTPPPTNLTWETLLFGLCAGPIMAVLGAWVPARDVCRQSELEGLANLELKPGKTVLWLAPIGGIVLIAVGSVIVYQIRRGAIGPTWIVPTGIAMFLGFLAITPLLTLPLLRGSDAVVPGGSLLKRLTVEQLLRRRGRTALTLGVLVLCVCNGMGMGHAIQNNIDDVKNWQRRQFPAEFILLSNRGAAATGGDGSEDALETDLRAIDGVTAVEAGRFLSARANGVGTNCLVRDLRPGGEFPFDAEGLDPADGIAAFRRGEAIVGMPLADQLGLKAGDSFTADVEGRRLPLKVGAVVLDYAFGGSVFYIDRAKYEGQLPPGSPEWLSIFSDRPADVEAAVRETAGKYEFVAFRQEESQRSLDTMLAGVVGSLWAMLALGFVVGGFATANTLTVNILEQTRDLGLLRIVGMTTGQVRRLCLRQAALLGAAGTAMGTLSGCGTAWMIQQCNQALLGYPVPLVWHGWILGLNAGLSLLVVAAAAWWPARYATKLNLLEALAYE